MPVARDLTNQKFGHLTALRRAPSRSGKTYWVCQCDCGNEKEIQTCHLVSGKIVSCTQCNERFCLNCGIKLHKGQVKYCSNLCQKDFERQQYINNVNNGIEEGTKKSGKNFKTSDSIRTYLLKKYNYKCQKCGWGEINPITGKSPLEIHHKDGNRTNNKEDNLELLCPNCHALTSNYKFLNSSQYKDSNSDAPVV